MLREDILEFINQIPSNVEIVAATKYVDAEQMRKLYNCGIHSFGENRVEAFLEKYNELSDLDIKWNFIGHLQKNKAKKIINKIDVLHSLDSLELAGIIDKERTKPLNCFIEVSINLEENKNGVPFKELNQFVSEVLKFKNVNIVGFMMMSKKNSTHDDLIKQFKSLAYLRDRVSKDFNISLPYLSMGMSDDYKEALACGATHIRLGRILWKN